MNEQKLKIAFEKLLADVATNDFYQRINMDNRVNCYTCRTCGHIAKTIDIHRGVTPFIFSCESCKKDAFSSNYKDIAPDLKPTIEWYRPELPELMKLNKKKPYFIDHILMGGLLQRKINQCDEINVDPIWKPEPEDD